MQFLKASFNGPNGVLACLLCLPGWVGAEVIEADTVLVRIIQQVDVPARTAGVLDSIEVNEGQTVKTNQLIAKIDDSEAVLLNEKSKLELGVAKMKAANDIAVRSSKAAMKFSRNEYLRAKNAVVARPQSVSEAEVARLKSQAEQAAYKHQNAQRDNGLAQASLRVKEHDLLLNSHYMERHRISAPLSGMVVEVFARAGEWVEPGQKVIRIVNLDRLRAEAFIRSDKTQAELQGASVELTVNRVGKASQKFRGRVVFIHPEIDNVNGQMRIWADIDNRSGMLQPGMRAQLQVFPKAKGDQKGS